jgi:uncharacterized protein (TIGR02646 family)
MIRLKRDRKKVPKGFHGAARIARNQALLDAVAAGTPLDNKYWKGKEHWKKAKDQLRAEANGKCAYCESQASAVTHADVEHFRPKDIYWWLAYCYDNYLYSCQICNQSFKSNRFPILGTLLAAPVAGIGADVLSPDPLDPAAADAFHVLCQAEQAGLVNPYFDDPEQFYAWEADEDLKEVRLKAKGAGAAFQVKSAEDFYGLNREELRRLRYQIYEMLLLLRKMRDADPATADQAMEMLAAADRPYAGMVRYFLREWGI